MIATTIVVQAHLIIDLETVSMIPRPRTEAMDTNQPDDVLVLLPHTITIHPLLAAIVIMPQTLT